MNSETHNKIIFSVVIPLYNKERHIQRAIRSVLNQTHQAFELIIIDDGSTDNSFEMAASIQDPRIQIFRQQNRGLPATRNRGVRESANEWIAFLDADDEWLPGFLETVNELQHEFPQSGCLSTSYYRAKENQMLDSPTDRMPYSLNWSGIIDDVFNAFRIYNPFFPSSIAIRRDALLAAGGFPEGVDYGEDTITWMKLGVTTTIAYKNTPLSIYHLDADNRMCLELDARLKDVNRITYLKKDLEEGRIPQKFIPSAQEYLWKHQISLAKREVAVGNNVKALSLLWESRKTRCYKKKLVVTTIRALIPFKIKVLRRKVLSWMKR